MFKTNKVHKGMVALAIGIAAAMTLAACAQAPGGPGPVVDNSGSSINNTGSSAGNSAAVNSAGDSQTPAPDAQNAAARTPASSANDFAFKLSAALLKDAGKGAGDQNFVCSPFSVWLPLAALANATDDKSKPALFEALNTSGFTAADLNAAASRMMNDLTRTRDKGTDYYYDPLNIANAIFVGNDVTLKKDFSQIFTDYYGGTPFNVDFSSPDAADAVNKWASENTDGRITNVIDAFDPETVAAIANAIYYSDRWRWEFDEAQTKEDVFHALSGDTKADFMLREGDGQPYYEDSDIQATQLTFGNGGGLFILLPKDGDANKLLSTMTSDYFNKIQTKVDMATGKLLLPRFTIQSDFQTLGDTLQSLGVPLFDKKTAPLTGGLIEEDIPVYLSSAAQKAMIQVDEKGTTAAAVTVLAAGMGGPMPTEPFEMNCNKPFAFILYDRTQDGGIQILFTGVVNQP